MFNIPTILHNGFSFAKQNTSIILGGVAIGGVVLTAALTGKGVLEADARLKELAENTPSPTTKDKAKAVLPCFVPAVLAGLGTWLCIIGSIRESHKALAAAIAVASTAKNELNESRGFVEKALGKKGVRQLDEHLNQEAAAKFYGKDVTVYETGHGSVLCCEGFLSGLIFRASREWVRKVVNEFNRFLLEGRSLCFNDFIKMLIPGIDEDLLPASGYLWYYDLSVKNQMLEIAEDSFLTADSDGAIYTFKPTWLPLIHHDDAKYAIVDYDECGYC